MKIFEFLKPIMRIFILFIVMSFIIACYYIDSRDYYAIEVNIRNVDMSDKRISLFIPKYLKSEHIIPENTESSGYNTDGYKYMFYRYGCDYRTEKTGDSTYTVEMRIGGNPDGKSEVKHVCTNYKDFKVVVFDNNENILKVSEACDFNLKEYEVLYKIDYDYITNTATPEYTYYRSFYLVRYEFSITVMMLLMPILSLMFFIVFIRGKLKGTLEFPVIYYNIMFMLYVIPLIIFIRFRTDYALKTHQSLSAIWEDFMNPVNVSYCFIPMVIFLIVMIWWFVSLFSGDKNSACNSSGDDV